MTSEINAKVKQMSFYAVFDVSADVCDFVLLDSILYVPSTSSYAEPVWINVLAQGHNTVTPVRLEPAAPRSRVKHSTTEPLRSRMFVVS